MNHQVVWAAFIVGSFIMLAVERQKENQLFCVLWWINIMVSFYAGMM